MLTSRNKEITDDDDDDETETLVTRSISFRIFI